MLQSEGIETSPKEMQGLTSGVEPHVQSKMDYLLQHLLLTFLKDSSCDVGN